MQLHELRRPKGSKRNKKLVGRGRGSGHGGTSCRGMDGQRSRSGEKVIRSFEGGQMMLIRRLPKVGFRSHRPIVYQIVNLESLNRFQENTVVDEALLKTKGLIKSFNKPFKILGGGELTRPLIIKAKNISKTAQEKIIKAGGKIQSGTDKETKS